MSRALPWILLLLLAAARAAAQPVDLLLVAADDALVQPVVARLEGPRHEVKAAWEFWSGRLAGKTMAITRSEGDPLNAVAATTLALRLHPAKLVVVYGASRRHDPALAAGDLVVSERFAAFDGMISPVTAGGKGSQPLTWQRLPHLVMTAGEDETPYESFPANAAAAQFARTLAWPQGRIVSGTLGSAPQVNLEADRVARLRTEWGTSTEDCESAHVAGCALLLGAPVVGFRTIDATPVATVDFVLRFVEGWK